MHAKGMSAIYKPADIQIGLIGFKLWINVFCAALLHQLGIRL